MLISKLTHYFHSNNTHLLEVLDLINEKWENKNRGYLIVPIEINGNNIEFGLPLRSNISHKAKGITKFITVTDNQSNKGLDYSKAVILSENDYYSNDPFWIPKPEFLKIKGRFIFISKKFEKYVNKYIKAVAAHDINVLKEYKYSTLQNYHKELGL